jgi:DUF4097 and DUF4098 domain-containing protein YvlB
MRAARIGSWALLAWLAGSIMYANVIGTPTVEFRQLYSLGQNGRVTVQNSYGDVSISAWDRDEVLVEAIKHSTDPRRSDEARIIVEPTAGALNIHTLYIGTDGLHQPSVEYRIVVPRTTSFDEIKLGNGGLKIRGVTGNVKASSVNGGIKAESLSGSANLSTVNGAVEAGFERVTASSPISLTSVNGAIRLSIPAGSGAKVSASNVSGGIDSEFGQPTRVQGAHKLTTTVHRGGPEIRLNNVNGGISIHTLAMKPANL